MAQRLFSCPCGKTFEGFTGSITADGNKCPVCGTACRPLWEPPSIQRHSTGFDYDGAPMAEIQDQLDMKAKLEANADKVRSGEWRIKQPKGLPAALRPEI